MWQFHGMWYIWEMFSQERIYLQGVQSVSCQLSAAGPLFFSAEFTPRLHSSGQLQTITLDTRIAGAWPHLPISDFSVGILHVGASDWAGQNSTGPTCTTLRIFLLNLSLIALYFHSYNASVLVWRVSLPIPAPLSLS